MKSEGRKRQAEAMRKRWAEVKALRNGKTENPPNMSEIRFEGWVVRASADKILIERC